MLGDRRTGTATVAAIKLVHTAAWFLIESAVVYLVWSGIAGRTDRRALTAAVIVTGESLVFACNGFRCPLTDLAESVGAAGGSVTDIYLPRWLARNLPVIHVPLLMAVVLLHRRNLRATRPATPAFRS